MWNKARMLLALLYAGAVVALAYWYLHAQRSHSRNFRVVTPGVLYRSGQLDRAGLEQVIHDYGIRTVISLRVDEQIRDGPKHWEEEYCKQNGIVFVRIPIQDEPGLEGEMLPVTEIVEVFKRVIADAEQHPRPILLHCLAGVHRTGALTAVYRMEFEHWSREEAFSEMESCGDMDVDTYMGGFFRRYVPSWKRGDGRSERRQDDAWVEREVAVAAERTPGTRPMGRARISDPTFRNAGVLCPSR
jgi:protein tyrosine phosphatase (PTP) superfamily phosphohydrolase (DUF442 family)